MKINLRAIAGVMIVMIFSLVLGTIFGAAAVGGLIYGTGVVVAGGMPTQQAMTGGDTLSDTTEYIDMRDVQRKVELYKPYQTPILTLMSDNAKGTCDSWEKKYFAVDSRGLNTTISAATTISSATTTLTVGNASIFTKSNTVFFPISGSTKISSGRTLMGIVTALPEANKITVLLVNPGNALAASDFTNGMVAQRGGSANNAKTASTTSWALTPEPDSNYVQLFMEQLEVEDFQEKMTKQIDWNFADMKRAAIDDFKLQLERTFLNGIKSSTNVLVDGQNQRVYTCGGFLQDVGIPVSDNITLSTLNEKVLNQLMKTIFTGNNGMKNRFLLGGADFIEALENVTADKKYIMAKETYSHLGLDFVKIVSMFGTLNVAYYEQLDLLGKAKQAIVVDKSNISTADFEPFNIRPIDLKSSGVAKVTAAVIEQTSTMLIKNKTTHRILVGV